MGSIARSCSCAVTLVFALAALAGCGNAPTPPVGPPVGSVTITPTTDTLVVGSQRLFTATATDTSGAPLSNPGLTWTSSDPGVFTVNTSGNVTAVGDGSALLTVEAGGKSDSATVYVFALSGWNAQASNTVANLNGVFFQPDGRRGWAVGDGGVIIATSNAGDTWAAQTSNTSFNLNGVWFTSATEGWAVGVNGTVMHTLNSGSLWTRLTNVGAGETLFDVHFATRDTGWAVGSAGAILRTFDRGASWTKINPTAFALHDVSFAGTMDGWAVGDNGTILGTHDRGLSWYPLATSITSQQLMGVWRRSEAQAWAAGDAGVAPRTFVGPDSTAWLLANTGASNQLQAVNFPTTLTGYMVGFNGNGIVLRSDDGGVNWYGQIANSTQQLNDVYFVDVLRGWAVGQGGRIVHTSRGGL